MILLFHWYINNIRVVYLRIQTTFLYTLSLYQNVDIEFTRCIAIMILLDKTDSFGTRNGSFRLFSQHEMDDNANKTKVMEQER